MFGIVLQGIRKHECHGFADVAALLPDKEFSSRSPPGEFLNRVKCMWSGE